MTGSGKTTLANTLLYARRYTVALKSKGDKSPLPGKLVKSTRAFRGSEADRVLVYPTYENQYPVFANILEDIWKEGKWTVYIDELYYLDRLKLAGYVDRLLTQGRSQDITVMLGMQRPANISRFALSEATHIIAFRMDGRDVQSHLRIAANDEFARVAATLSRYEFAWHYKPEGRTWRGRVQDLIAPVNAPTLAAT